MLTRKEMKQRARNILHSHYGILLVACLLAAFLGGEFTGTLGFISYQDEPAEMEDLSGTGTTISPNPGTRTDALLYALLGNIDEGKEISRQITDQAVQNTKEGKGNPIFGRSRGVIARIVNGISSGSFVIQAIAAARNIGASQNSILIVFILGALGIYFSVWFFLTNMYQVVSRRIFLECRVYEKVPIQRFLVFLRIRKWSKVSFTMFMTSLFYFLWSLTIVGRWIKKYSYYLVPYIVAENPDISWKDAITLSRKMMNGHKWECFVCELSFLPWDILGEISLGLVRIFFLNPYKEAFFTEYYVCLRALAKEQKMEGSVLLNDRYLYEKAAGELLRESYKDVILLSQEADWEVPLQGFRGFLANVFGITIFNRSDEERYMENERRKLKIASMESIVEGRAYPGRLFSIPESQKDRRLEYIQYLRHYSIPSLILLFFIFSFVGWIWEVSLHLVGEGVFVNRGVLHGPWLPIYGTGGVLILTLLNQFRKNPWMEFIATVLVCGSVEYLTSYLLEKIHDGTKWWDYSGYFLNLNGRICAEGLLVFGVGGMAIVYVAAPLLDNYLRKIKYRVSVPVCGIMLAILLTDTVISQKLPNTGKGVTDYKGAYVEKTERGEEI